MRRKDAREGARNCKVSKEELEAAKAKEDIEMNPTALYLEMVKE